MERKATYIKLFTAWGDAFNRLSDDEAGRLIKAIFSYAVDEVMPTDEYLGNNAGLLWSLISGIVRSNLERMKDDRRAETSAENGRKGGRPRKKPNSDNEKPKLDSDKTYQNQTLKKKEILNNEVLNSESRKKKYENDLESLITEFTDVEELRVALRGYLEMRRKRKNEPTKRAMQIQLKNLSQLSNDVSLQIAIVDQSIVHGWLEFYEVKPKKDANGIPYLPVNDTKLDAIFGGN